MKTRIRFIPILFVLGVLAVSGLQPVFALRIETGNDDLEVRWDNNLKYSAMFRVASKIDELTLEDAAGTNSPLSSDDGNRNFDPGLVSNRVSLLSEFDIGYKRMIGIRLSGAAWYDHVYNQSNDHDAPGRSNTLSVPYDEFLETTEKLHGRDAELLDYFAWISAPLGNTGMRGSMKAGQHALLWGEALFFSGNAIAGLQGPVDLIKGLSVPASQAKEIIRPVEQVSAQLSVTPTVALVGYYQLEWEGLRFPGAGSYFSTSDVGGGGELLRTDMVWPGSGYHHGQDIQARDDGQFGLGVKFRLKEVDLGVYGINYHAKAPVAYLSPGLGANPAIGKVGEIFFVYPEDIKAYGLSANYCFGNTVVAAEVGYRQDSPLTSNTQVVSPGDGADNNSDPRYAIGNGYTANLSFIMTLNRNFIANSGSLLGEIAWNYLDAIEKNENALDPYATKEAYAFRIKYSANYLNALQGLDLTPSISASYSPRGKSSLQLLGVPNEGGDITLGVDCTYLTVWSASLSYTHYYGSANTTTNAAGKFNYAQTMADRNFIAFQINRTF
ncbi:MAG: DUF1302 family protein [Desulfatitalea sp.]|nr:DUF1302 domain-containing protein [Desulfatitalea sp.]NNK00743.1 DUF1302 family protein [Desulfatitalea sp.]